MYLHKMSKYNEWGPLVLRVTAGLIFALAGYGKLFVAGPAGVAPFFASLGIPAAGFFAWAVGLTELVGGLMLILGVLARWAAIPLAATMVVALFTAKWGSWTTAGNIDLMLLATMVALFFMGAGKYALYPEERCAQRKKRRR